MALIRLFVDCIVFSGFRSLKSLPFFIKVLLNTKEFDQSFIHLFFFSCSCIVTTGTDRREHWVRISEEQVKALRRRKVAFPHHRRTPPGSGHLGGSGRLLRLSLAEVEDLLAYRLSMRRHERSQILESCTNKATFRLNIICTSINHRKRTLTP
jgi:hypothetical protein